MPLEGKLVFFRGHGVYGGSRFIRLTAAFWERLPQSCLSKLMFNVCRVLCQHKHACSADSQRGEEDRWELPEHSGEEQTSSSSRPPAQVLPSVGENLPPQRHLKASLSQDTCSQTFLT